MTRRTAGVDTVRRARAADSRAGRRVHSLPGILPGAQRSLLASGLTLVALAVSLLAVAPAGAAPSWLSPVKLSAPGLNVEKPQVAVDAGGDAVSVWENATKVEASGRTAGSGSWQAPTTISNTTESASSPHVALDDQGDAVAVWESFDGTEYGIQVATRSGLTGAWQAPVTLKTLGTGMEPAPDVAIDARGDAVVVWQRMRMTEGIVEASSRPAGGSWQSPETLSESAEVQHPAEVAIDAAGDATAVWEDRKTGDVLINAATKPSSGKWQSPVALSKAGANANEPRIAVDARGDAVAAWERPNGEEIIEAAARPASTGAWGASVALTKPELGRGEPANQQVAIDGQGDAVVVWSRTDAANHDIVEASVGSASTSVWQAPAQLSAPGATVEERPQVGVNDHGDAVVVWERSNGTNEVIEGASGQAASGSWQAPVALSAAGQEAAEPQVALDAHGNAAAVWRRFDGMSYRAEAAAFDAAGPLLNALVIPATGTVGQALAFSTSPLDVWSALGATGWSFGDGTSQAGASVTHAYGSPGTYSVTVTSADVLGNATSASASVSITATPTTGAQGSTTGAPGSTTSQGSTGKAVAPEITEARVSPSRFRASKLSTAISAKAGGRGKAKGKAPQGTAFHFTLSQPAEVQIAFTRSAAGLRGGGHCLAPSKVLKRHHAKRCTRTLTAGTLTRVGVPSGWTASRSADGSAHNRCHRAPTRRFSPPVPAVSARCPSRCR